MCIVTWFVSGRDFDVDGFLKRFPAFECDDSWRRGDDGLARKVREDSGFSLTLFEGKNPKGAVQAVRSALDQRRDVYAALAELSVQSKLHFGLYVGAKDSFVPALSLAAEDLEFFARLGVTVVVLGYPVSDDD
ncbi:hypothetical protein [Cystobacter ferrugineus]|uniref:DUF4279 domain-containing protein n=1 Tax=Cystobacter ferrugineus TaxID=83449 RepID=A0A1L9B900_9BACT|nr:hypothetical protein [Cystobacter ferrugineus]OJH38711.1 hypothetical protein BON30_20995 [Cystobacter ferrugineus]